MTSPSAAERAGPTFRTLGHGDIVAGSGPVLAVDPWRRRPGDAPAADAVLVTSARADAASPEDVFAARTADAPVVCPHAATRRFADAGFPVIAARPGDVVRVAGAVLRALPAAAPDRARGFLPADASLTWLAETNGARWLFLGASDALRDHEGLAPDVAFFAVGDFDFPTPEEAAASAARVRPALAVPTHWGDLSARFEAARRFVDLCTAQGIRAMPIHAAE